MFLLCEESLKTQDECSLMRGRANSPVPMCLPVWHGVSWLSLGSLVCCCPAVHSSPSGSTEPCRATAHSSQRLPVKRQARPGSSPGLCGRAVTLSSASQGTPVPRAAVAGGTHSPRAARPSRLLSSWWAGGSWIDFLCALQRTSRGLPGASVFSLAALARAIVTSKLSSLLSFIPSDTHQLLRGWFDPRCGVSQSAFDSIC